jgi:hypothetical protein
MSMPCIFFEEYYRVFVRWNLGVTLTLLTFRQAFEMVLIKAVAHRSAALCEACEIIRDFRDESGQRGNTS